VAVRIVTLLLHDERFSGWSIDEKMRRLHFSKQYLKFCKSFGWEPYLYCFHQSLREKQVYEIEDVGVIKVFPVEFRFPPRLRFGNDHNPKALLRELTRDRPDLIHFHQYYMFSFPYIAKFVKTKLNCPLTTQLHGYHQRWMRRLFYLPSLLSLKMVDRVFYSYKPEEEVYRILNLLDKAVRVPMPSINPEIFKPSRKDNEENLLYVGRVPLSLSTYGDKSPIHLLSLLRRLLCYTDVKLTIVGDGPGLPYCKHLASELEIEGNVDFKGYLPHSVLPEYYQSSRLTLVPMELDNVDGFFDGAIQESLACGTTVAAFKSSSRTPSEGSLGFLLSKDVKDAAAEVSVLLDEPEVLDKMSMKGSRFVRRHCTEERLKQKLRFEWEGLMKR
jgi:glycosyltransferase involved in cell wall biosynthesis